MPTQNIGVKIVSEKFMAVLIGKKANSTHCDIINTKTRKRVMLATLEELTAAGHTVYQFDTIQELGKWLAED